MKIKESIKNESIKSYKDIMKSNQSYNLQSEIRKYIESLNLLKSQHIQSSFTNNNYQFVPYKFRIPKNLYIFLEYSFLSLFYLISKPLIEITPDKIILILFCFRLNKNIISKNKKLNENIGILKSKNNINKSIENIDRIKLRILSLILRKFFKKTVELEIIQLHYPYYETNIFVNLLSKIINKIKIDIILSKFFDKANIFNPNKLIGIKLSNIPSFVSGIKIRIAGRLMTQRIIPRKTVKNISKGNLNKTIYLEKGRFTNKNKRGAFNIMVTIGHTKL